MIARSQRWERRAMALQRLAAWHQKCRAAAVAGKACLVAAATGRRRFARTTALPRAVVAFDLAGGEQQVGRVAFVALFRQAYVQRQAGKVGGQGFAASVVVAVEVLEVGLAVGAGLGA